MENFNPQPCLIEMQRHPQTVQMLQVEINGFLALHCTTRYHGPQIQPFPNGLIKEVRCG